MNLENEDQSSLAKASETFCGSQKRSKISYSRKFLLYFNELDICKKLPVGFDQSLLSEFEDAFHGIQDRPRIPGSVPLQGFRHSEYSSSPPTRGDSDSYSRGIYGRWGSRSSGRRVRDSDSQSDWDPNSGKRYGNQSWQSSDNDGLLGRGSFPKPPEYAAGLSVPKVRANDHSQLNRSNEPYHPPRPYKAVPHSRRDATDSYNDETFGSADCTSQDKAEEERRRRSSFELMRKEQQKVLQEKQKLNHGKLRDDSVDIMSLLEDTKEKERLRDKNNELDAATTPMSNTDSGKTSFPSRTPASRPLVPPGFANTISERNSGAKSLVRTHLTEVGKPEIERGLLHVKLNPLPNGTLDNQEESLSAHEIGLIEQQTEEESVHAAFSHKAEKIVNSSLGFDVSNKTLGVYNHLHRTSSLSEAHEAPDDGEVIELTAKKVTGDKIIGDSTRDNSTSVLEKLFGSALIVDIGGSSGLVVEDHAGKQDETCISAAVQSSKFAHWFLEDEKKPVDEASSGRPSDLLSLIVGSEKSGPQVSDVKANQHFSLEVSCPSSELSYRLMTSNIPYTSTGISEQLYNCIKPAAVSEVLTCEDLEQTILSDYSENSSTLQSSVEGWTLSGVTTKQPKANIDDYASRHLLSLIHKGTGPKDSAPSPIKYTGSSDRLHASEVGNFGSTFDKPGEANDETIHNSGKTLTLETLFGNAFMKELQSFEAPVSIQRGSAGSAGADEPHGLSFPVMDDGQFPSAIDETVYKRKNHESIALASTYRQQTKYDKIDSWLGYDDPQIEADLSKLQNKIVPEFSGLDGTVEIQLPEECNLISVADPVNPPNSMFIHSGNSARGEFLSSDASVDITEKLAALNAAIEDERSVIGQDGWPFARSPYDMMEPEIRYRNLHAQPSSPQFQSPKLNHGRPLFHPLDSHSAYINSQMKFMPPEDIIHYDVPPNHQFPANMLRNPFDHPSVGLTGYDLPVHQPTRQQMQMPDNFPPHHLLREFPRGAPLPPHPSNQGRGFIQEPNPMQDYPFGHWQPNSSGTGMPLPGGDVNRGSVHPEAFQRLIEMELRANAKQSHSFAAGRSQGMYGHELDTGFRYR